MHYFLGRAEARFNLNVRRGPPHRGLGARLRGHRYSFWLESKRIFASASCQAASRKSEVGSTYRYPLFRRGSPQPMSWCNSLLTKTKWTHINQIGAPVPHHLEPSGTPKPGFRNSFLHPDAVQHSRAIPGADSVRNLRKKSNLRVAPVHYRFDIAQASHLRSDQSFFGLLEEFSHLRSLLLPACA